MPQDEITTARKNIAAGEAIVARASDQITRIAHRATFPAPRPVPPPASDEPLSIAAMVERIMQAQARYRPVLAALGLARLREFHEATHPTEPWSDFVRRHVPLARDRVDELIGRLVHRGALLRCTSCGTTAKCPCGCGVPYVSDHPWANADPVTKATALERAAAAVAAHPEKSNRAIAAEIGVSFETVRRARAGRKAAAADVSPDVSPERTSP
jgi:hypothetical protein